MALAVEALNLLRSCVSVQRGRRLLGAPEFLPHITRLLLSETAGIAAQAVHMLATVLTAENALTPLAHRAGLFECVLYMLGHHPAAPGVEAAAALLAATHRRQADLAGESYLSASLPAPMIALLDSYPKKFGSVLTSATDVMEPQVIWRRAYLTHLAEHLTEHLAPVLSLLRADPHGEVVWPARGTIAYPQLDEYLFLGKMYIDCLIADEKCIPADSVGLFLELATALHRYRPSSRAGVVRRARGGKCWLCGAFAGCFVRGPSLWIPCN